MLKEIMFVGTGGFVGSIVRYLVSVAMKHVGTGFPWGTLIVNVLGCFLIGLFYGLADRFTSMSSHLLLFLTVGVCGGFTTFSTFSREGLGLLQGGNVWAFAAYVLASVVLGLLAVCLGGWAVK